MRKFWITAGVALTSFVFLAAPSFAAGGDIGGASPSAMKGSSQDSFVMSNLVGKSVTNQQNEQLGTVENLVIGENGRVSYIIMSPAQGIAEKDQFVAIPWSAANPRMQQDKVFLNLSQSQLRNAPTFARSDWSQLQNPQWQQRVNAYFRQNQRQREIEPGMREQELERGTMDSQKSGSRTNFHMRNIAASPRAGRGDFTRIPSSENARLEDLIGQRVVSQQGQNLGTVEDLVLSENGQIRYIILSRSMIQGFEDKVAAIPWNAAQPSIQPNALMVNISQSKLNSAPHFSQNQLSNLESPQMQHRINSYYGVGSMREMRGGGMMTGMRANALIGELMTNTQGQQLGVVKDLFTNEMGCIKYVILSPAEEMEMGNRLVAIPFNVVQSDIERETLTADISQSKLRDAPTFTSQNWRDYINNPQFDQRVHSYFGVEPAGMDSSMMREYYPERVSIFRATEMVDQNVMNRQNQELGTLEDLVTDDSGRIKYLLISSAQRPNQIIAIPWQAANPSLREDQLVIDVSQQQFFSAPSLTRNNLQQLDNPQWERRIHSYFEAPSQYRQRQQRMRPEYGEEYEQDFRGGYGR
ncbi:MAG: PRC-barrel domain containing protein [Candidatus Abyssobacteria bacterium SURF_5]|uniref:PRC-barrel domain containing protein n=1 Tax=Abyssobacteria bacterium (strain SURF_5) TaxID=2093360 RepID=A0A3A4PBP2_ABYX5|nr:MAG: PRC-barrel domain containing protein [Candidatus Abyssubacteria bacterium SURF_5]